MHPTVVHEIKRADVQCRWNADTSTFSGKSFHERRAAIAVIQTAVNVRRADGGKARCPEHGSRFDEDAHGDLRRGAARPGE